MERIDIKVGVVGDPAAGKTTLCKNIVDGKYEGERMSTVGVETFQTIKFHNEKEFKILLFDTPGQETRFNVSTGFLRYTSCILLLFDPTKEHKTESICDSVEAWTKIIREKTNAPIFLVATHSDLFPNGVEPFDRNMLMKRFKDIKVFSISSLTGNNIDDLLEFIMEHVRPVDKNANQRSIGISKPVQKEKQCC
jgi:small GTP-binding protein